MVRGVNRDSNPKEKLLQMDMRAERTSPIEIAAAENRRIPKRTGPHSIRSGGANAMFVAGYDTVAIKRWGWESDRCAAYLRKDDRVLTSVGRVVILDTALLPQLKRNLTMAEIAKRREMAGYQ